MKPRSSPGILACSICISCYVAPGAKPEKSAVEERSMADPSTLTPLGMTAGLPPSLEPEPHTVPGAAEKSGDRHVLQRHHRILAQQLVLQRDLDRAYLLSDADRRHQRLHAHQIRFQLIGEAARHADI